MTRRKDPELDALAAMLGITDDDVDEVPDHVKVSVGELDEPPDEDEVD